MDTVYLEYICGFDAQGNPEPLREVGLNVVIERMEGGEVVTDIGTVRIKPSPDAKLDAPGRIVPDTRTIATSNPRVVEALLDCGQYVLADPPGAKAAETTADHRASRQRQAKTPRIEE